jgi:hypothetical protein
MASHDSPIAMPESIEERVKKMNILLDRLDGLYGCPDCNHDQAIRELTQQVEDEFSRTSEDLRAEIQEVHLPEVASVVYLLMLQKLQMKTEDSLQEPRGAPQNIIRTRRKFFRRVGLLSTEDMEAWAQDARFFILKLFSLGSSANCMKVCPYGETRCMQKEKYFW